MEGESTDAELVERTRGGDQEAYAILVTRYQGHVYGLAYSLVGDWAEAQDLAQDTFVRAYLNLAHLRDPSRFAAWLRRVTFSVSMNWLKSFRQELFRALDGRLDLADLDLPDFAPAPPEAMAHQELAAAVQKAVDALPPRYRVPLTMFHLDGLSYEKVAGFLDIPLGTAKSLIHRARAQLRIALAAYATEEGSPMLQEVFDEHKLPAQFAARVLDRVPRLAWGTQRECTFIGALEAALAPSERPQTYADMMGWSGLAFRTRWFAGNERQRWCPSSPVGEMEEEIAAVARATGWPLRVAFVQPQDAEAMKQLTAEFVASINAGRPVLAYEPRLSMAVVFGYEEGGEKLLIRDYFHPEAPLRLAAAELGFLALFVSEPAVPSPACEAFAEALRTAVLHWRCGKHAEGPGEYWYGDAAFRRWHDDLGEVDRLMPEERSLLSRVSWRCFVCLHDARLAAVSFLYGHCSRLPAAAQAALGTAADLYEREAALLGRALTSQDAFINTPEDWPSARRECERGLLIQAREYETEAIAAIEAALACI